MPSLRLPLAACLPFLCLACGGSAELIESRPTFEAEAASHSLSPKDLEGAECKAYPVPFTPDPLAEARARKVLEELGVEASLQWSNSRGTLGSLDGMTVQLPECADGKIAEAIVLDFALGMPDLFQLGSGEWRARTSTDCAQLKSGSPAWMSFDRDSMAGQAVRKDALSFSVRKVDGALQLVAVFGVYLPPATKELASAMEECGEAPLGKQETAVLEASYPFSTFQYCVSTGSGKYGPNGSEPSSWRATPPGSGRMIRIP